MKEVLCIDCRKRTGCKDPLPHDECDSFEREYKDYFILSLFRGMKSHSKQKAIIEIMEVMQEK